MITSNNKYKKHLSGDKSFFEINSPLLIKNTVSIQFNVGSIQDPKTKDGLSHLTEHLILNIKGNGDKLYVDREMKGLYINAFTGRERTVYTASSYILSTKEIVKELFSLLNFKPTQKDLLQEIQTITSEILQNKTNVNNQNYDKSLSECSKIYKDLNNYKHNVLGNKKSINGILLEDVYKHIDKYYINPSIAVTSSQKLNGVEIKQIFDQIEKGLIFRKNDVRLKNNNLLKVDQFEFMNKNTQIFGFCFMNSDREREDVYLSVLKEYLANNWSSVCNQRMRIEKQLTYFVNNFCQIFDNFSMLYVYYDVSKKNKSLAEKEYKKIIKELYCGDVNKNIFEAAKNMLLSNTYDLLTSEENVCNDFLWFNQYTEDGPLYFIEKFIESVKKLTLKDFVVYLKDIL